MPIDRDQWQPPEPPVRRSRRHVPGALNGSLLLEQPALRPTREAIAQFVAPGPKLAVEVGFDHGMVLLANARLYPHWRWLGVEIRRRRVAAVVPHAPENCLPVRLDARSLFALCLPDGRVDRVDILFPTPTERSRHLLFSEAFVADLARAMSETAVLHIATDVPAMAELVADLFVGWRPAAALPRASDLSRRERVCQRDGVEVCRVDLSPPL